MTEEIGPLIQRAQNRDLEALDIIVERYASRVFGYIVRLTGKGPVAEELVQEVFVRVVRTIDRYQHSGKFESWLFRIATNLVRDRARASGRRPTIQSLDQPSGSDDDGPRQQADPSTHQPDWSMRQGEDRDALQKALSRLPDAERQVVLLRHYGEMSFNDIAALMDTPVGTALARAHRGLAKLRKWMEEAA